MARVTYEGVSRYYGKSATPAVDGLNLDIADGEFLVLVGPSGCGKSTSLRMLAGLEPTDRGRITIDGRDVTGVSPAERNVAMVFQNYALYPNMTVAQNMGFALRNQGVDKATIAAKVREAARILQLESLLDRKPANLSGGQRQRVAMGRAIVREPAVFCMDEPLSNLDAKLRVSTRGQISALQKRLGTTTVYVTHDQVEAMTMGDRVAVLKDGVLQQVASPQDIYERPANAFVAGFIGSPAMNFFRAEVTGDGVFIGGGGGCACLWPPGRARLLPVRWAGLRAPRARGGLPWASAPRTWRWALRGRAWPRGCSTWSTSATSPTPS
ncbi:ABC transporter ATP-binding protein [Corynebacterium mastitidis]|uniref:ABC transporter ATP-binding protein n=1 Tax=Corynebacterium mastitidis TaxID=161890 RepID=A0ABU8P2L9_9CORY